MILQEKNGYNEGRRILKRKSVMSTRGPPKSWTIIIQLFCGSNKVMLFFFLFVFFVSFHGEFHRKKRNDEGSNQQKSFFLFLDFCNKMSDMTCVLISKKSIFYIYRHHYLEQQLLTNRNITREKK